MHKEDLVRFHTLDGSTRDLRRSPDGALVFYDMIKKAVMENMQGICRMLRVPGAEAEADRHNECIANLEALFEDKDPLDDEIAQAEKKLTELKERKNEKKSKTTYGYTP